MGHNTIQGRSILSRCHIAYRVFPTIERLRRSA
uniref:Uncharacterized protein n=1 Tax=Anguilla anguilla TaxID=7936 RepID=A0A0E9SHP3_ANGAN